MADFDYIAAWHRGDYGPPGCEPMPMVPRLRMAAQTLNKSHVLLPEFLCEVADELERLLELEKAVDEMYGY